MEQESKCSCKFLLFFYFNSGTSVDQIKQEIHPGPTNTSETQPKLSYINGGSGFLEFGNWRIGVYDKLHFAFTHRSGYTAMLFRSDGTVHQGPRTDYNLWQKKRESSISDIKFLDKCVEFDHVWRLCEMDNRHLSLASLNAQTCMIWRVDGIQFPGPRKDYNGFTKTMNAKLVKFGDRFVQVGYWRLGEFDSDTFSIGTATIVSHIFVSDGTVYKGPSMDYRIERQPKSIVRS